jgi:hypothetical protein
MSRRRSSATRLVIEGIPAPALRQSPPARSAQADRANFRPFRGLRLPSAAQRRPRPQGIEAFG